MVSEDARPFWRKLTNIGIAIVAAAGTVGPVLLAVGEWRGALVCAAIGAAGAALGIKGAAQRADALREEIIKAQQGKEKG